jgi:site-specific DNA-methyltransferase (adenine-specific)
MDNPIENKGGIMIQTSQRSPRNKTLKLSPNEQRAYSKRLISLKDSASVSTITDRIIRQDLFDALPFLPQNFVDLLVIDPPYNLTMDFGEAHFQRAPDADYQAWVMQWLPALRATLKPTASVYVCSDWRTSPLIYPLLNDLFTVRNRITWEREKGRGANANWKNAAEDIWFCTVGAEYTFNVDAVKLRRRVLAPYRSEDGLPKDWSEGHDGRTRLTHPSNLWTDITVPFWSMAENTEHPTQKPEKLIAKLILASSQQGDMVLDPFLGSGTSAVVAKKLKRHYVGVEIDTAYACLAEKRLALAEENPRIQGYQDGVFWERNSRT